MQPTPPAPPPPATPPAAAAPPPTHPPPTPVPTSRPPQKPSMGRVVFYHTHGHPVPEIWPADILRVNPDGTLMLFVKTAKGVMNVNNVAEGTGVNQWSWPVYV